MIVVGSWWGLKPECVISAASYHSFQREEHLCSSVSNPASSTGPTYPITQPVLHVEYTLVYCSSFGNFASSLQIHCDRVFVQSFPFWTFAFWTSGWRIPDEIKQNRSSRLVGTGSSSWCCAVVAIRGKKHLVTGKVTPSSTTKEGIYNTVQCSASSCTDKSRLTEQQALSRISRENRGDKNLKRRKGGVGNAWELGCLVFSLKCCRWKHVTCFSNLHLSGSWGMVSD